MQALKRQRFDLMTVHALHSCPGNPDMQNATTPRSCGTSVCASFISAMDDRKFTLVRAGLQVRACRLLTFATVPVVHIPTVHSCNVRKRIFAIMQARAWPVA